MLGVQLTIQRPLQININNPLRINTLTQIPIRIHGTNIQHGLGFHDPRIRDDDINPAEAGNGTFKTCRELCPVDDIDWDKDPALRVREFRDEVLCVCA